MLKLMTIFVMPGNIICYGQGFSPSTGYTYDENGHVQTIEELWGDVDAANKYKFNALIGNIIGTITLTAASAYLVDFLLGALAPAIAKFAIWLTGKGHKFLVVAKNLGFTAALKLLTGTPFYDLVKNLPVETWQKMFNISEYYKISYQIAFALAILLDVTITGVTLSQLLQGMEVLYLPSFKVSESFYSGNTADHNAWETNFVNLQSEISSLSPVVQGIIMIPPKLDKINNTKSNFPWETISEYY